MLCNLRTLQRIAGESAREVVEVWRMPRRDARWQLERILAYLLSVSLSLVVSHTLFMAD
jgi:hypothetical protein